MKAPPSGWRVALGVPLALMLIRLLALTWRVNTVNAETLASARGPGRPVVFAFWHSHIVPLLHAHRRENITVLVSEHRDGEIIARIAAGFGFPSVRGSTSRGAVRSLLALVRVVRAGGDVGVTPDGPRGPARSFAPGVLLVAQRAGAPLVTIAAHASRAWRLKTWDRFVIPKPFATISVAYGAPHSIAADASVDESVREFEQLMAETCSRAGEPVAS
jgi:lysophospholipid acyltransferase (LPLAT)-like uncharacterized protein